MRQEEEGKAEGRRKQRHRAISKVNKLVAELKVFTGYVHLDFF